MSLVTFNTLKQFVAQDILTPVREEYINGASIDVRLGQTFWFEDPNSTADIDLVNKESPRLIPVHADIEDRIPLHPLSFCLASTIEVFNLPNHVACEFRLKSTLARSGLDQSLAVWCDPGWHGSVLTIELFNNLSHHRLLLTPGMKIGQVVFYTGEAVPDQNSYATKGQYNKDTASTPSKGIR